MSRAVWATYVEGEGLIAVMTGLSEPLIND